MYVLTRPPVGAELLRGSLKHEASLEMFQKHDKSCMVTGVCALYLLQSDATT